MLTTPLAPHYTARQKFNANDLMSIDGRGLAAVPAGQGRLNAAACRSSCLARAVLLPRTAALEIPALARAEAVLATRRGSCTACRRPGGREWTGIN
jgi:hypothetical protein